MKDLKQQKMSLNLILGNRESPGVFQTWQEPVASREPYQPCAELAGGEETW